MHKLVNPEGWPRPNGYSNAVVAEGQMVFVAGQIGWRPNGVFVTDAFADQVRQALENTLAILQAAGAGPEHVVRQTWYITDKYEYLANLKEVGAAWRETMGRNFPAMAVVQVTALIEDRAKVEIESTAVLPTV